MNLVIIIKNLLQIGGAELLFAYELKGLRQKQINLKVYCINFNYGILNELDIADIVNPVKKIELFKIFLKNSRFYFVGGFEFIPFLKIINPKSIILIADHHPIVCKPLNSERKILHSTIDKNLILKEWNKYNRHYEYKNLLNSTLLYSYYRHFINKYVYCNTIPLVLSDFSVEEKKYLYKAKAFKKLPLKFFNNTGKKLTKKKQVLHVGRIEKSKRIDFLIDCFIESKLQSEGYIFILAGEGFEKDQLEKKYSSETIQFLGRISQNQKEILYSQSEIVVNGQVADFNLTEIEAHEYGCIYFKVGDENSFLKGIYLPNDKKQLVDLLNKRLLNGHHLNNDTDPRIDFIIEKINQ